MIQNDSLVPLSTILIYQGDKNYKGVSMESVDTLVKLFQKYGKVENVEGKHVTPTKWGQGELFVLPGGCCSEWEGELVVEKQKELFEWFKGGGKIFGICAGSYFCSSQSEYVLNNKEKLTRTRNIALFQGICKGPTFSTTLRIAKMTWMRTCKQGYVAVIGGGSFFPDQNNIPGSCEILARYSDEEKTDSIAIVKCKQKNGVGVLLSPHIEFDSCHLEYLKNTDSHRIEEIETMQKLLDESIAFRQECIEEMIKLFLNKSD